jgi:hypothetical protein
MLSEWLNECIHHRRLDVYIGDKEVGEGWESMSCPFCEGFIVVWEVGVGLLFDPTVPFSSHMKDKHRISVADLTRWKGKGGNW